MISEHVAASRGDYLGACQLISARSRCSPLKGGMNPQSPSNSGDVCFRHTERVRLTWRCSNSTIHAGGKTRVILLFFLCMQGLVLWRGRHFYISSQVSAPSWRTQYSTQCVCSPCAHSLCVCKLPCAPRQCTQAQCASSLNEAILIRCHYTHKVKFWIVVFFTTLFLNPKKQVSNST